MKSIYLKSLITICIIFMLLLNPELSTQYAFMGLSQWAAKMVPTLFPFMMISSIMIYTGIDQILSSFLIRLLKPLFPKCSSSGIYVIFIGFLCGFPMGAKVACDMYHNNKISKDEAEYLLCFCNNIGPSFFLGLIIPILKELGYKNIIFFLFGMYGIPLMYGSIINRVSKMTYMSQSKNHNGSFANAPHNFFEILRICCIENTKAIILLGGYITFISIFRIIPDILSLSPISSSIISLIIEINSGIKTVYLSNLSEAAKAFFILTALCFSGISCFLQAGCFISKEGLSMSNYIKHHIILTIITGVYYYIYLYIIIPSL